MQRRRTVLLVVLLSLAPAFLLTRALVASYRSTRQQLAVEWGTRADRDLRAGRPSAAVDDYRTALSYAADDRAYRLRLADALLASGRRDEAEAHLLTLWSDEPGNGRINLELGRLAVAHGDLAAATRHYHAAIDGAWDEHATEARRTARLELARALVAGGRRGEAQAELIALADDAGDDPALLIEVGRQLAAAGAENRALTAYRRALELAPGNARAAALAGDAAFRLGDYASAREYLTIAAAAGALDAVTADERALSARVLALDPFARRIALRERTRRTVAIFEIARDRLAACRERAAATGQPLSAAEELVPTVERLTPQLGQRRAARDDDLLDEALDTAFRIEDLPAAACGAPSIDDRAVALLARERQEPPR